MAQWIVPDSQTSRCTELSFADSRAHFEWVESMHSVADIIIMVYDYNLHHYERVCFRTIPRYVCMQIDKLQWRNKQTKYVKYVQFNDNSNYGITSGNSTFLSLLGFQRHIYCDHSHTQTFGITPRTDYSYGNVHSWNLHHDVPKLPIQDAVLLS